jgi:hypothetical protein
LQLNDLVTQDQTAFFHASQAQFVELNGHRHGLVNPCIQVGMLDLAFDQLTLG